MVDTLSLNYLPENGDWPDQIPRLEDGWWPTGGAVDPANDSGLMNWQAQLLAQRTQILKSAIEAHTAMVGRPVPDEGLVWSSDGALMVNSTGGVVVLAGVTRAELEAAGLVEFFSRFSTSLLGEATPAGAVASFAFGTPPVGWLECDGSAISRGAYADLFAAVGTEFGVGDGATTFNIPDLRGQFLRGWDNGRGVDAGRDLGSEQGDAIRNIYGRVGSNGTQFDSLFGQTGPNTTGVFSAERTDGSKKISGDTPTNGVVTRLIFDASTYVPTADENRPKNTALMFCVKY